MGLRAYTTRKEWEVDFTELSFKRTPIPVGEGRVGVPRGCGLGMQEPTINSAQVGGAGPMLAATKLKNVRLRMAALPNMSAAELAKSTAEEIPYVWQKSLHWRCTSTPAKTSDGRNTPHSGPYGESCMRNYGTNAKDS